MKFSVLANFSECNSPRVGSMPVWRVEYRQNRGHVLNPRGHLSNNSDLQRLRQRHLAWDKGFASPFVSVFTNKTHAIRWGNRQRGGWLYEIETRHLNFIHGGENELLIIGSIPDDHVVRRTSVHDEWVDIQVRESEHVDRSYRPHRFQHPDTLGWYSDEEDAYSDIDALDYAEYVMNH